MAPFYAPTGSVPERTALDFLAPGVSIRERDRKLADFASPPTANGVTMNTQHDRPSTPTLSRAWKCVVDVDRGRVALRPGQSCMTCDADRSLIDAILRK